LNRNVIILAYRKECSTLDTANDLIAAQALHRGGSLASVYRGLRPVLMLGTAKEIQAELYAAGAVERAVDLIDE